MPDVVERLDRLESLDQIRQLVSRYAFAVDARDLDLLVELYVDDVRVGETVGRDALRAVFDASLRQFTSSAHLIAGHVIDFDDADHARGMVGCRIEHEVGDQWVVAVNVYHDRYVRRAGVWFFQGRVQTRLYSTPSDQPPLGPDKIRWPGAAPFDGHFHDALPAWHAFWTGAADSRAAPAPTAGFIERLRGTKSLPRPPRYIF